MHDSAAVSILVIAKLDDQVEAINNALRDAGQAARCCKIDKLADLESAIQQQAPRLIAVFENASQTNLQSTTAALGKLSADVPVLLVSNDVTEATIAAALARGARDAVSLANTARLQAVALRELRACQNALNLKNVMQSAAQFRNELNSLKQGSVEAIADIQEGIIVTANPAWIELFGHAPGTDLSGQPIMDLCAASDRPAIKGALQACQRGKWTEKELRVKGLHADAREFSIAFSLEAIEHDGEPAVRMLVAPPVQEQIAPIAMVEKALQRDPVTGLFNQPHFLNAAVERLRAATTRGVRAFAFIRLDRFSRARDELGLLGTEAVITQFAQLLREYIQPADVYGRVGGTMFAVVIERGNMVDVESWADRFRHSVANTVFEHNNRSTVVTCSIGLCEIDCASLDIEKLLIESEAACTSSRRASGNRVSLSHSSGAAKKIRQDDGVWGPRIRSALLENRLRLEHQPIASLNNDIDGTYDTLVRMLDDEGNTILPSEFMPVAERTGLSKNIDRWVIGASFSYCASGKAKLVFVRLSSDSLLDESLINWLLSHAAECGVDTASICFEISEELAARHMRQTLTLANAMRGAGFRFALEHFGKAQGSADLIGRIPMDYLKIDGSLMQGLHKNADVQAKVKEFVRLATTHGALTIAERVQDANTMAVLWQLGVSYIEGNYVQSSEIVIEDTNPTSMTTRTLSLAPDQKRKLAIELQ